MIIHYKKSLRKSEGVTTLLVGALLRRTFSSQTTRRMSSGSAASLAPADMRGRYMSLFSLTWGVAQGIGPAEWRGRRR